MMEEQVVLLLPYPLQLVEQVVLLIAAAVAVD
jgi:hypothetical protein